MKCKLQGFVLLSLLSSVASCCSGTAEAADVPITFYGKVVDQHGAAVEEAQVFARVRSSTGLTKLAFITDAEGRFEFADIPGRSLFVHAIAKKGYEYPRDDRNSRASSWHPSGQNAPVPDRRAPVVFHIRRRGETTFLLRSQRQATFTRPAQTKGFDLVQKRLLDLDRANPRVANKHYFDLRIQVVYSAEGDSYEVTITVPSGGILQSSELLYEAPAEGYQSQYQLVVKVNDDERPTDPMKRNLYLYTRSRSPLIYTGLTVGFYPTQRRLGMMYTVWTNPYGERCLEYEPDIPARLYLDLLKQARKALCAGSLPKKPDLAGNIGSKQE